MKAVVVGAGAVGARAARQLLTAPQLESLTVIDADPERTDAVVAALGTPAREGEWDAATVAGADVVVLATPDGHRERAELCLEQGTDVVSVSDEIDEVRGLLRLDAEAQERERSIVVGAGFSPGLSCVLARHAASGFDRVDEIHVAKVGTGGPACARQHHDALGGIALDWRDGAWSRRRGGSGRELCWFPDPVGAVDCYRAALPEAALLVPAFGHVIRVTARMGASRRDRFTARLPMLRPPHPEGGAGAVRAEVRGCRGAVHEVKVLGAMDRPAVAAGAVAAVATIWVAENRLTRRGAAGLAELVQPVPFLAELARRGVKAAVFEGADAASRTRG
jgi:saccharopine dehydrogenase-like NADP-dependent oxidoreductase